MKIKKIEHLSMLKGGLWFKWNKEMKIRTNLKKQFLLEFGDHGAIKLSTGEWIKLVITDSGIYFNNERIKKFK